MVIDDEYYAREALISVIYCSLLDQANTFIQSFDSAKRAIEAMPNFIPDILFTDIRMDEMSGLDLCEFIHQNFPSVTLIIISGYADFSYAQKAIRFNVDRYLTKPISKEDIKEILERFILKSQGKPLCTPPSSNIIESNSNSSKFLHSDEASDVIDASYRRLIQHYMIENNIFSLLEILQESFDIFLSQYGFNKPMLKKYFISILEIIQSYDTALEQNDKFLDIKNETTKKANQIINIATASTLMDEILNHLKLVLSENITSETSLAEKIIAYIENHYFDDLNMNDIAKKVFFISPNYLSKLVNDATGLRFSKYLLKVRMENALKILARNDLSISEVARLTGYNSESHFIQLFKKYYGITPKYYKSTLLK